MAAFLIATGRPAAVGWIRRRPRPARRPRRRRRPRDGAESPGYDAALAVLAAASFGVTELLVRAIGNAGGFYLHAIQAGSQISAWATVSAQIAAEAENLLILFGANFWVSCRSRRPPSPTCTWPALAVALLGLLIAIARWRRSDRVTRALVVGVLVMLVGGRGQPADDPASAARTRSPSCCRSARCSAAGSSAPGWPSGGGRGQAGSPAGAGRAGDGGLRARRRRARPAVRPRLRRRAAGRPRQGPADLADWLLAHHLTSGLSGYWNANIATLETGGQVHLAPLISGGKYGYLWESKASWFNPDVSRANFIVTTTQPTGGSDVPLQDVLSWYSKPAEIYQFQQYSILVYDRNVLESVVQPVPSQLYAPPGLDGEGRTTGEVPPPSVSARNGGL